METEVYLSVVIPAYNEEKRLLRHVPGIVSFLSGKDRPFEIIVVDDGSQDATARVTKELAKKYPMMRMISYKPNCGKGGAVRRGMLAAQGRYVLFTDADQSTPITEVDKLLAKIESEHYDMAIASRRVAGAKVEESQAFFRALSSRLFAVAVRALCIRGIADTQCGFKCMTRDVAQKVFLQVTTNSPLFDVEMLVVAVHEGYRIAEVPVRWVHDADTRIPYTYRRSVGIWGELLHIRRAQRIGWPVTVKGSVSEKRR
jgi:dolichyl-phosphate beta-glucosyltransferase